MLWYFKVYIVIFNYFTKLLLINWILELFYRTTCDICNSESAFVNLYEFFLTRVEYANKTWSNTLEIFYFSCVRVQQNQQRRKKKKQFNCKHDKDSTYVATDDTDVDVYSTTGTDIGEDEFFDCSDSENGISDIENRSVYCYLTYELLYSKFAFISQRVLHWAYFQTDFGSKIILSPSFLHL